MNRICFRLAIARPDVGFDYFGGWNAYNPGPVLEEARRTLVQTPNAPIRLQSSQGQGKEVDLGWDPAWLDLLALQLSPGVTQAQWNRLASDVLMRNAEA